MLLSAYFILEYESTISCSFHLALQVVHFRDRPSHVSDIDRRFSSDHASQESRKKVYILSPSRRFLPEKGLTMLASDAWIKMPGGCMEHSFMSHKMFSFAFTPIVVLMITVGTVEFATSKEGQAQKKAKETQQGESRTSEEKIAEPDDCSNIRSGTTGSASEAAAQKDCESSRHLGAGSGVSSGTGSGKMRPGGGSR